VAKKKNTKALFEVIASTPGKGEGRLGVPGWFGQPARQGAGAGEGTTGPAPNAPAEERSAPPVAAVTGASRTVGEAVLSVSGGRLRISLNQVSAVVAVLVLILLPAAAFMLGRRTAPRAAGMTRVGGPKAGGLPRGNIPAARRTDLQRLLPTPGAAQRRPSTGTHPGMVPDNYPRKKGCNYLVIQGNIASYEKARQIKRFLWENGIDATIHGPSRSGRYKVKDTRPFSNLRSPATRRAIWEYVSLIESLGKQFERRYNFAQRRTDDLPWMEPGD